MAAFAEGAPCWADISLPDVAAGRRFYGELFGWTFHDQGEEFGNYTMALLGADNAAGLMGTMDESQPTAWSVYFATADAAKAAARVTEAGGRILFGPDQVGDVGSMVVATDPGGSLFGLWQPGSHPGFGVVEQPGAFCWTENHTRDVAAVDPFFRALFGYSTQQVGDGVAFDYEVWSLPGDPEAQVAGRMNTGGAPAEQPPAFLVYFSVADCDAAVASVERLGGKVAQEPQDSPFGRLAVVTDDQGATFAVIDLARTVSEVPGQ